MLINLLKGGRKRGIFFLTPKKDRFFPIHVTLINVKPQEKNS